MKIEKIISSGDGIAWDDNKTYFVPFTLPGEEISVIRSRKDRSFYRVEEFSFNKSSPFRREPVCPNFGVCGGCSFLHIDYGYQKEIKLLILEEFFKKEKMDNFPASFFSVDEFGARNRAKICISNGKPSFFKRFSHDPVFFKKCPLISPELNDIIQKDSRIRPDGELQYEYSSASKEWLPEKKKIIKIVHGEEFLVSRGSFFQSSESAAEILVSYFLEKLELVKPSTMLDLFCGVGLFSKFAVKKGVTVTGVEIAGSSVNDFKENMGTSAKILLTDAGKAEIPPKVDLIVVDPPRTGIEKELVERINKSRLNDIIYISCGPPTFMRDVALLKKGGFCIKDIGVADIFPNTSHFEIMAHISR